MKLFQEEITIRQPDDWHVHLRDGEILKTVVPQTARIFRRAVVMPNLNEPIITVDAAIAYKKNILESLPIDCSVNLICAIISLSCFGSIENQ